jgi:hypothetical protein
MKTKLTLTIEQSVVAEAKRHAAARGTSLSRVVEMALQEKTRDDRPRFGDKWRGRFEPARRRSARYKALVKRYA